MGQKTALLIPLVILAIVANLVVFAVVFLKKPQVTNGYLQTTQGGLVDQNQQTTSPQPQKQCKLEGFQPREKYLPQFKTQKGDTLIKIATNILGDATRAQELSILNAKEDGQPLATTTIFANEESILLPPKDEKETNGLIYVVSGRITESDDSWSIGFNDSNIGSFDKLDLPKGITNDTCVIVVYQGIEINRQVSSGFKVFEVKTQ